MTTPPATPIQTATTATRANDFHQIEPSEVNLVLDRNNVLGTGGFGTVYRSTMLNTSKDVAIKVIEKSTLPVRGLSPNIEADVLKEANSMFKARNDHVVDVYGIIMDHTQNLYALVMEYMKYGSLNEFMKRDGVDLPWPIRVKMMYDVSEGLLWLHSKGPGKTERIVHQDIKIQNILVDEHIRAKISDFGLARIKKSTKSSIAFTRTNVAGTMTHVAPERLSDQRVSPNEKTDVYSYGITMFEMSGSGESPWENDDDIFISHLVTSPTFTCAITGQCISRLSDGCPKPVQDLMCACTMKDAESRPFFQELTKKLKETYNVMEESYNIALFALLKQLGVSDARGVDIPDTLLPVQETHSPARKVRQTVSDLTVKMQRLNMDSSKLQNPKYSQEANDITQKLQDIQYQVNTNTETINQHVLMSIQSQILELSKQMTTLQSQMALGTPPRANTPQRQYGPLHQKLIDNQVALVSDMDPSNYFARLIQDGAITMEDKEVIESLPTRRGRAEKLIAILLTKNEKYIESLKKAMTESGQEHLTDLL